ncbi:GmrSD restriction endonuclease domain-containing protein [Flavisolibacter ginsenosidimutans]|uniref:DUF262 domain-containing protein n=1 Tax=Flavisolibacter ginsenosidimutans TaxID=661481 RepID=A0A5B8UGM0_9BACT|nr:DUF262 domain-containing protein [Flavisolibacter ginsenosidimutans]QEC55653.1 DUF262 domain-containing protein [Flavisolibacter ginsenosidimutans]
MALEPKSTGFRSIKNLMNKINANRDLEKATVVSVDDDDVPAWQRQIVWNEVEMGLLAYSILMGYPIGVIILWQKPDGVRVPIDGRQRLTAIKEFFNGNVAIPNLPKVNETFRNKKYKLHNGDLEKGFIAVTSKEKDLFEDYELNIIQYENIDEETAMDIFVMLQGGKSLTKTEVRAALGGKLCDFITELTSTSVSSDDETEEEPVPQHSLFKSLAKNVRNVRKAHRNIADVLVHEVLYPNQDKHWSSLEIMYRDKVKGLTETDKNKVRSLLNRFKKDFTRKINQQDVLAPQLRSAFFILSVFKAWKELHEEYDLPSHVNFPSLLANFERLRVENPDEYPFINFTAALSNAGYAQNRIKQRHEILLSFFLKEIPTAMPKDRDRRNFSVEQKIAIWEKAKHQCEFKDDKDVRCAEIFTNFKDADADHIIKWSNNGPTTVENGRLLCQRHNRGRKD